MIGREFICVLLAFALLFSGCASVRMDYRAHATDQAHVKVACYWRDLGGNRVYVNGLTIKLVALDQEGAQPLRAVTAEPEPVRFSNLAPGRYRLVVAERNKEYLSKTVRLRPGQELSVKIHVKGRGTQEATVKTGKTLGKAFVLIVVVAAFAGLAYLKACSNDSDWD